MSSSTWETHFLNEHIVWSTHTEQSRRKEGQPTLPRINSIHHYNEGVLSPTHLFGHCYSVCIITKRKIIQTRELRNMQLAYNDSCGLLNWWVLVNLRFWACIQTIQIIVHTCTIRRKVIKHFQLWFALEIVKEATHNITYKRFTSLSPY